MSSNALEGNIPWSFGYPPLHWVDLSHNIHSRTVPQSLTGTGTQLMVLDLSNNKLQGQMLPKDANITMLMILHLSGNHFEGVISPNISNCPSLRILDVRHNDLSSNIPEWLYDHSPLVALILSGNCFEGHLPQRLCWVKILQIFDISHNCLSGGIPSCLDNKTYLRHPYLFKLDYIPSFVPSEAQMSLCIKNRIYTFKGIPLLMMTALDLSSN
ncbi:hypothetical protein I3843_05G060800 [Carya illinoinensis]|nr:hypothetical protein I3843_05G060800 [Carya illinoinensis]